MKLKQSSIFKRFFLSSLIPTIQSILLVGCTTFGDLEKGLQTLVGQPVQTAVNVIGYPDGKVPVDNETIYIWGNRNLGSYIVPQTSYSSGYVGNQYYSGQTQYNQTVYYEQNCEIKLVCDSSDTIINWQYRGNIAGCKPYISRLDSYREQIKKSETLQCSEECQRLAENGSLKNGETVESCVQKSCGE